MPDREDLNKKARDKSWMSTTPRFPSLAAISAISLNSVEAENEGVAEIEKENVNTDVSRHLTPKMLLIMSITAVLSRNEAKPKKNVWTQEEAVSASTAAYFTK